MEFRVEGAGFGVLDVGVYSLNDAAPSVWHKPLDQALRDVGFQRS